MEKKIPKFIKDDKSSKDIIIIISVTFFLSIILIQADAFELFYNFTINHEEYELDEIILVILVLPFSLVWYSYRRYKEIKKLTVLLENINTKLSTEHVKKDNLLFEQSKMASLGEMLENIAHQWRQPLNSISLNASSLKIKKQYCGLEENELEETLDNIVVSTNYLSDTIDNFRSFIKDENKKIVFNPNKNINKNLNILKGNLTNSNIKVILDLNTNFEVFSYANELTQVFINIVNNAKDALISSNVNKKYIFISTKVSNNKLEIIIKDNAGGIPKNIISKIFEPYFTTKHKTQGTGLGLYMSYKILEEKIKGKILVKNTNFTYENEKYKGAQFSIIIPVEN